MQRRGSSGQPVKGQYHRPKARKALTAPTSTAELQEQLNRHTHERDEAREQQAATAEVLKVISRSTFDLQTVFDTIVVNAVRLCHAHMGAVHRFDGKLIHIVAHHNFPLEAVEVLQRMYPRPPQPDQASGRAILTREVAEIEDMPADRQYTREVTVAGQWGSILAVPMLRDGAPIGAIVITRNEVGRFAARHIDLLKTFADQAVIAIENARLFNETKEALEQQTATSEVLKVISSSPGELQRVFEAMLANATRLCEASYGNMWLCEGDQLRTAALHGPLPAAYVEFLEQWRTRTLLHPGPELASMRAVKTRQTVQVPDLRGSQAYLDGEPVAVAGVEVAGIRTLLAVPMLKEKEPVGVIAVYRKEVRPFTDKQIELVQNFASQAVIAIENTLLLNELRESLQQQTATADVLKVISRSTFDLKTVLNTLVESSASLCEAYDSTIWQSDGKRLLMVAHYGPINVESLPLIRGTVAGRTFLDGGTIHIGDLPREVD